ncbi:MAG: low temperature requirement protein A, partial [Micrococcaceae bacterium]|nr:low temperature requirement protein A [Micrococcaceae bacterium]
LMVTNNLYGQRYSSMGVLVVAAMPGPAAMAIAMAAGIEGYGWLYAVGAAWVRVVLLAMWLFPFMTGAVSVSPWRPLGYNLATAALWIGSIFLESPYRYLLWAVAVAVEMLLLMLRRGFAVEVYEQASIPHLLERIGLFVVIVIGEAVYLSVTGLAGHPTIGGAASAMFGFVSCALLARAFFRWAAPITESGLAAARNARSYGAMRDVVMYFPFITVLALTLIAASIGIAVAEAGIPMAGEARWLLATGVAGFYLSNALIGLRLGRGPGRVALLFSVGAILPAIACLLTGGIPAWATLGFVALALLLLDALSGLLNARWRQAA